MLAVFVAGVATLLVGVTIFAVALVVLNGFPRDGRGF